VPPGFYKKLEHLKINNMKLRIALLNIHGLVRGNNLEIGRDADNGGQTRYVFELAEYLSRHPKVKFVHIYTRLIDDPDVDKCYSKPVEIVNEKLDIRRIPFGGKKYKPKEYLWDYLDDFVSETIQHMNKFDIIPNWLHSHYGDAGYTAVELSKTSCCSSVLRISPTAQSALAIAFQ